jgi:nucleoside-diphosphate-sugar epimerase
MVTGAGGFTGAALARRLIGLRGQAGYFGNITSLVLVDCEIVAKPDAPFVRIVAGDITDRQVQEEAIGSGIDCLFHLAAVPGGAAETNERLGRAVNFDASRDLADALSRHDNCTRVVFASSIGVFGTPMPSAIDDDTYPVPSMSYGAQKLMVETLLADVSRRGWIDARSVRLPGIVARPREKTGHISAYMSEIFHALLAGEPFVCPVSAGAQSWLMSLRRCVDNLLLAALIPAEAPGSRRAWTLPALRLSMADLADAIGKAAGRDVSHLVRHEPIQEIEAQFGRYPPLSTPRADALGFLHDGSAGDLVRNVIQHPLG